MIQNPATSPKQEQSPAMAFHLRLVAKLALSAGVVSGLVLAGVIFHLTREGGDSYWEMSRGFASARRMLFPSLLVSGLILTMGAALVTWVVSLYSTTRVAGPLFRFAMELDRVMEEGPVALEPLRQGDLFREEFQEFSEAVQTLQNHYDEMSELVDHARVRLEEGEEGFITVMNRLGELESRAKL